MVELKVRDQQGFSKNYISDRFLGFVINLNDYFQLCKSIFQTTLKNRALPIFIETCVPKKYYLQL